MKEQEYGSHQPPKFNRMSKEEVIAYFDSYKFLDQEGHSLALCDDFIRLIELAIHKH